MNELTQMPCFESKTFKTGHPCIRNRNFLTKVGENHAQARRRLLASLSGVRFRGTWSAGRANPTRWDPQAS